MISVRLDNRRCSNSQIPPLKKNKELYINYFPIVCK